MLLRVNDVQRRVADNVFVALSTDCVCVCVCVTCVLYIVAYTPWSTPSPAVAWRSGSTSQVNMPYIKYIYPHTALSTAATN